MPNCNWLQTKNKNVWILLLFAFNLKDSLWIKWTEKRNANHGRGGNLYFFVRYLFIVPIDFNWNVAVNTLLLCRSVRCDRWCHRHFQQCCHRHVISSSFLVMHYGTDIVYLSYSVIDSLGKEAAATATKKSHFQIDSWCISIYTTSNGLKCLMDTMVIAHLLFSSYFSFTYFAHNFCFGELGNHFIFVLRSRNKYIYIHKYLYETSLIAAWNNGCAKNNGWAEQTNEHTKKQPKEETLLLLYNCIIRLCVHYVNLMMTYLLSRHIVSGNERKKNTTNTFFFVSDYSECIA